MATSPNYRSGSRRGSRYRSGQGRDAYRQERNGYVYGNLAHQLEEIPERRTQPVRRRKTKTYPQQKPVAMPSIGFSSFVFLMAALSLVLVAGFMYLHVQSGITQMKNEVISLQSEIADAKQENDDAYQKVMDSVDLSEVYAIATGQLGMIQAVDNQVYKYDNKKSDMVKQYGDIPASSK